MIVLQRPIPIKLHWARAWVVVLGLVVLPFGTANAQDYDAVEKRLGKAVAKGEINLEQAQVMMEALRRNSHRDPTWSRMREGIQHRINEIKELVEKREISREEGARLIEDTRRALVDPFNRDGEARKRQYAQLERRIKAAVREGELSYEDAEKKLIAVRKELFGKGSHDETLDARKKRYAEYEREIDIAVGEGKLSSEEAERKLIELRKEIFQD